jgi:hypothetical protein
MSYCLILVLASVCALAAAEFRDAGLFDTPCHEPAPRRFYLYEWDEFAHCVPAKPKHRYRQIKRIRSLGADEAGRVGGSLFFHHQLREHPWRTLDPAEASLFVVPALLDLAAVGECDYGWDPSMYPGQRLHGTHAFYERIELLGQRVTALLKQSPWYQRRQGADHLTLTTHYRVRKILFQRTPKKSSKARVPGIRHTFRNFIFALKNGRQLHIRNKGTPEKAWEMPLPNSCVFPVPHVAPSALHKCNLQQTKGGHDRLVCPHNAKESSAEEYMATRNVSLYFAGNTARPSDNHIRAEAVLGLAKAQTPFPNVLISTTKELNLPVCIVDAERGRVGPVPCATDGHLDGNVFGALMEMAQFSISIKGTDAGSSRVFEGLDSGTLQLVLADHYMEEIAPFKCRVPWEEVVQVVPETPFVANPAKTVDRVLEGMYKDDARRLRKMWDMQHIAAQDLLWHVPGSRVGHNVLEDALRCLDSPASWAPGSLRRKYE